MEPTVIGLYVTAILGFITGVAGVILNFRKNKREEHLGDANVATIYQTMAAAQALKNQELTRSQEILENKVDDLERAVIQLRVEKEVEVAYSNSLVEYIEELITLMKQAGIRPVKDVPKRKHT